MTIAEKYWIVTHAETRRFVAQVVRDFASKFSRKISRSAIVKILRQKKAIRDIVGNGTDLDTSRVKFVTPEILQFQTDLAEEIRKIYIKEHVTYDMIAVTGKELQNQPNYVQNESVRRIRFSNTFITNFKKRHGFISD